MAENANEGHPQKTISEIAAFAKQSLPERPNVILLHAGTNDMNIPFEPDSAPIRLSFFIDEIFNACPDAALLVARIIPAASRETNARIDAYNAAIVDLIKTRQDTGQHIMLVDMNKIISATTDLVDGLHPNEQGYHRMGIGWLEAIKLVSSLGWIPQPVDVASPPAHGKVKCEKLPGWIEANPKQIANGAGLGQNMYDGISCADDPANRLGQPANCLCDPGRNYGGIIYKQQKVGLTCAAMSVGNISAVRFADLNGDGRAEYLWVSEEGHVTGFLNLGPPDQGPHAANVDWCLPQEVAGGVGGRRHEIQFADMNGDGRAEYLWVHADGSVYCWLNSGSEDSGPYAAKVKWVEVGKVADGFGTAGAGVRLVDINGDGRADYLSISPSGEVHAYLNLGPIVGGFSAANVGWLDQGIIAQGVGVGRDSVIFADLNGDGRADYLAVSHTNGAVNAWYNQGGQDNGPHALENINWWQAPQVAGGVGTDGTGVQFADLNGDGRAEYLDVDSKTSAVNAWVNGC
ncbi:hypothetical protein LTR50_006239 [Elasticomyces elasticus]|nr:hypothetical protein LTR50_006239 [Elasticomyces elasticus]